MSSVDDQKIIDALHQNHPNAWNNLLHAYGGHVYGIALRILTNEKDAEDVCQDVWLTVVTKLQSFRGDSKLSTWLYRITVNKCLERRRTSFRKKTDSVEKYLPQFDDTGHHKNQYIDWSQKPAVSLENKMLRDEIERTVKSIPLDYREVLILRDIEGLSGMEVAEVLDISLASVKTRLHRARSYVREKLSRKYGAKPWFALLRVMVL